MSVVVCGSFSSINNPTFDSLAMWNGTTLSKPYTASLFTYLGIPPAGVSGSYGSLLPSFINGIVKRSNGDLYISITYPSGQSSPYKGIYRWNGTAWSTIFSYENVIAIDIHTASDTIYFTTGHNSNVYKVAPSSNTPEKIGVSDAMEMSGCIAINQTTGDLYYGGQFSNMLDLNTYTPILSVENLARYSGGTWYPFGGQTIDGNQPTPKKMVVSPSGYVYVIDGNSGGNGNGLWFWMGTEWHIFYQDWMMTQRYFGSNFKAICASSDNPYVSFYDGVDGGVYQMDITKFSNLSEFQVQIGTAKPKMIRSLAVCNGYLYAGFSYDYGEYNYYSSGNLNIKSLIGNGLGYGLTKINLSSGDWVSFSSSDPSGVDGDVVSLMSSGSNLYLVGSFYYSLTGATEARSLALVSESGGLTKKLGFTAYAPSLGGDINATITKVEYAPNGDLYVLGNMTKVYDDAGNATDVPLTGSIGSYTIACWDGVTWSFPITSLTYTVDIQSFAICPATGKLYICGGFSAVNGVSVSNIAMWDGNTWDGMSGGRDSYCTYVTVEKNGVVFVGGYFTGKVARYDFDGMSGYWSSVGDGSSVSSISIDPFSGDIYASVSDGMSFYNRACRWFAATNSWKQLGDTPTDSSVAYIYTDGITSYVAGSFSYAGGVERKCAAIWDVLTNTWSDWGDPTYFTYSYLGNGIKYGDKFYFCSSSGGMSVPPNKFLLYYWDGTAFYPCSIALGATAYVTTSPDITSPTPGGGGKITLSWTLASDNATPQSQLQYRVYQSTTPSLGTVTDIETNGIPITGWETDLSSVSVDRDTYQLHYFNILVRDNSGNKSVYQQERAFQGGVGVATYYKIIKGDTGVTGIAGGIPSATIQSSNYAASSGDLVVCRQGASVTLPVNPSVGDWVKLILSAVNNSIPISVVVHRNGSKINSASSDVTLNHTTGTYAEEFLAVYQDSTVGWCLNI